MNRRDPPPIPDPSWAYFFDIDGTLVRFAQSPQHVRIHSSLRRLIEGLYASTGGAVAFITGRHVADVDRLFPGVTLAVAGQHGAERRSLNGRMATRTRPPHRLFRVRDELADSVARYSGLLLEDKGLSLALHYRRAPRLASYAHRLARSAVDVLGSRYVLQRGKQVVEVRPRGDHKGSAIMEFMKERPFRGRLPVFLGDDVTDERGFAAVNRLGGHSVKIGPGASAARWRLRDVAAVRAWLRSGARFASRNP